jgi:hypothetical protein
MPTQSRPALAWTIWSGLRVRGDAETAPRSRERQSVIARGRLGDLGVTYAAPRPIASGTTLSSLSLRTTFPCSSETPAIAGGASAPPAAPINALRTTSGCHRGARWARSCVRRRATVCVVGTGRVPTRAGLRVGRQGGATSCAPGGPMAPATRRPSGSPGADSRGRSGDVRERLPASRSASEIPLSAATEAEVSGAARPTNHLQ